jgi:hypothetical protein
VLFRNEDSGAERKILSGRAVMGLISISGGKKVTGASDPVAVTVGAQAQAYGSVFGDAIAIEFTGTECHVIQIFIRTKIVDGKASTERFNKDSGGLNTTHFSDPNSPEWDVDTTSPTVPYYDFGYSGEQFGTQFIMVDGPSMKSDKFTLSGASDITTFDAYAFCLCNKDIIAIVKWDLVKHADASLTPTASLLQADAWWKCLELGRRVLTKKGYNADLFLPAACIN